MSLFQNGVPLRGAPLFFLIPLLLSAASRAGAEAVPAPGDPGTPLPAAMADTTAAQGRVVLSADHLIYHEDTGSISAEGNVRLWYGSLTLTAQSAEADLETRMVYADGDVTLTEAGRKIRSARLAYDLKTRSALAEGILFASYPWYYQGTRVDKRGDKEIIISSPRFTTCNARHPHYYVSASRIEIIIGESLTAYDAIFHIGTTPVFYWPWFWRSLKDGRPPFALQAGYNDSEGAYVKARVNYFLLDQNYGSLLIDFMEKRGLGLGLEHRFHYALAGHGDGELSAYYIRDKLAGETRWTANLQNRHEISPTDTVQMNLDYLSSVDFSEDYYSYATDTFQQKSYLAYSRRATEYYLGFIVQDTETLDPVSRQYYPSLRQLPGLDFSLNSTKIADVGAPVYFSLNSSFVRGYVRADWEGTTADASGNTLVSVTNINYRFLDTFNLTPALTQTYAAPLWVLTQPSLSWTLGLPWSGYVKETLVPGYAADQSEPSARLDAAYTTSVTLTNKWVNYQKTNPTHLLESRLSHGFSRKIAHLDEPGIANAGVTSNRMGLSLDYYAGSLARFQTSTGYNFLSSAGDPVSRLDALSLVGSFNLLPFNLTWQSQYQWTTGKFSSGYVSAGTYGKGWTLSLNTSYAYQGPYASGLTPPADYREYSVYSSVNGTLQTNLGFAVQSSAQYDFSRNRLNTFTVGIRRDLHCWEMQAGYTRTLASDGYQDQFGMGINLKAFPAFRAGTPGAGGFSLGE